MKKLIEYYYHIYPKELHRDGKRYYFFVKNIKYYFFVFERDIKEISYLVEISNYLYNKGILNNTFIKNINEEFYVEYMNDFYVLIRVNSYEDKEYGLEELVRFNSLLTSDPKLRTIPSWIERWKNQIDAFEEQISEYNNEYPVLLGYFDYYIGLAENAVSYVNMLKTENEEYSLCHKELEYPLTSKCILDPTNYMVDYKVRDVAEYIKLKFINGDFESFELIDFLNKQLLHLSEYDARYLLARIIYPNYYFNFFEELLVGNVDEKDFKLFIDFSEDYEELIKKTYKLLSQKYQLDPIDWIEKKQ